MSARTGEAYITGLKEHPREVWIDGEQVQDVTTHPALRNGVRSVAALYDMQHDPALREAMTYTSPTTGQPVGLSFLMPQSVADLERRRTMMAHWAWASCGMMGRSPDFLNVLFTAWAGAADYFAQNRPEFKQNVLHYYEFLREQDVTLTHALVNLQRRRTPALVDTLHEDVALTVVRETDAGIILRGSRLLATLGPIADELAVSDSSGLSGSAPLLPQPLDVSTHCAHHVSSIPTATRREMRHGPHHQTDPREPHHDRRFPRCSYLLRVAQRWQSIRRVCPGFHPLSGFSAYTQIDL